MSDYDCQWCGEGRGYEHGDFPLLVCDDCWEECYVCRQTAPNAARAETPEALTHLDEHGEYPFKRCPAHADHPDIGEPE